jgi:hypothetical protein
MIHTILDDQPIELLAFLQVANARHGYCRVPDAMRSVVIRVIPASSFSVQPDLYPVYNGCPMKSCANNPADMINDSSRKDQWAAAANRVRLVNGHDFLASACVTLREQSKGESWIDGTS